MKGRERRKEGGNNGNSGNKSVLKRNEIKKVNQGKR